MRDYPSDTVFHIIQARTDDQALCGLIVQTTEKTTAAIMLRDAYLRHHAGKARHAPPRFCVECQLRADAH